MEEEWHQWHTLDYITKTFYIYKINYNKKGLFIVCGNENNSIQIFFRKTVLAFRNVDDGHWLETWDFLEKNYSSVFNGKKRFFKSKNSAFISWFKNEFYEKIDDYSITHYLFLSGDVIFEVLATEEPIITRI